MLSILSKIRSVFTGKRYRAASDLNLSHRLDVNSGYMRMVTKSRQEFFLEWCSAFNERNGYVVPSKSVRSIFNKVHAARFRA